MEGEIFYVSIVGKFNTLNFEGDAHYTFVKVKTVSSYQFTILLVFFLKSAWIPQNLLL